MPNANIALKSIVERYRGMSDFRPTETRFESLKPKKLAIYYVSTK